MIKDKCNITASCKECPYYNGFECEATERQRAFIGKYIGYGKIELMSVCYDKDERIAELELALKLACERVKYFEEMQDKEMGHFEFFGYDNEYDLQAIIEKYMEQSKEMMKSE